MRFRRALGAAVAGAALLAAIGGAGTAHATPAYGVADIIFSNFGLTGILGATQPILDSTVTTGASSNYPGQVQSRSGTGTLTGGVGPLAAFTGPCATCVAGTFTPVLAPLNSGNSGSQAQVSIVGPITSAVSSEISESNLTLGGSVSGGETDTNTGIDIVFIASTTSIDLSFDAQDMVSALVGTIQDGAAAKVSGTYELIDETTGTIVRDVSPPDLNIQETNANPLLNGIKTITNTGLHFDFTDTVHPGDIYSISLQSTTSVQLSTVPEPISLAVLGSGLFALGVVRRRKKV